MAIRPKNDSGSKVVICGAGAAGMAAALAVARAGISPVLIEKQGTTGGTVTGSLIHTLGGLYDDEGSFLQQGLARELAERLQAADARVCRRKMGKVWVLNVHPELYARVTGDWLKEEGVDTWLDSRVTGGTLTGSHIDSLTIQGREGETTRLDCSAVVDCTGSAEVVRILAPDRVDDADASAAAGLIFRLRNVKRTAITFPRNMQLLHQMRKAVAQGRLPEPCEKTWIDSGTRNDDAYVKLFIPLRPGWRRPEEWSRIEKQALALRDQLVRFLHELPGFENALIEKTGRIGIRDGGRVEGEALLKKADILRGRRFPHPAARCQWPIEFWHPRKGVSVEYLAPGSSYEIPLETLKVRSIENLWAAGKSFSAEPMARASARVVGCCWGMGEAAGIASAKYSLVEEP